MPSFDVVSEVDFHEVRNAVDQANREIRNRYDFKGSDARVEQTEQRLTLYADDEYKVGQALDILQNKLAKRRVDLGCLEIRDVDSSQGGKAKQDVLVRHGIDTDLGRRIVKRIKDSKFKLQGAIQGDRVRVSGKKRDDLQEAITMLKAEDLDLPLQYINFRD